MTYPKCQYCHRPVQWKPDDHYYGEGWSTNLCGLHIDIEFCCNVSKDAWGTKSLARFVALDYGMSDVVQELDRCEEQAVGSK